MFSATDWANCSHLAIDMPIAIADFDVDPTARIVGREQNRP